METQGCQLCGWEYTSATKYAGWSLKSQEGLKIPTDCCWFWERLLPSMTSSGMSRVAVLRGNAAARVCRGPLGFLLHRAAVH